MLKLGEVRKSVVFNLNTQEQREMLKFAEGINFSAWVRGCIKRELIKRAKQSEEASITYRAEG